MAARNSPPYALVIFVFLWVIATGVAIWLAVQRGDDAKKLADATAKAVAANAEKTKAEALVSRLKLTIASEPGKSADDVISESGKLLSDAGLGSMTLMPAFRDLHTRAQQSEKTATELRAQNDDWKRQVEEAIKAKDTAGTASSATLNQEKRKADAALADLARTRADNETLLAAKEAAHTAASEEWEQEKRTLVLKNSQLEQDLVTRDSLLVQAREQIVALRPKVGTTLAGIESAGLVVRAQPGTKECYINLGHKDRVTAGLTFSVHDPRIGVKLPTETDLNKTNTDPDLGGKASIEILQVTGENESLCRITYVRRGQVILPGDLIANLFYQQNKNKKFHFVIFGDFDLDGDGVATAAERERLVRLINTWGGVVDEKITPNTDYLVLGTRPAAPITTVAAAAGEAGGVVDQQTLNQGIYDDLFIEAKRASVPVLNANRFLTFIGFYNNTVAP